MKGSGLTSNNFHQVPSTIISSLSCKVLIRVQHPGSLGPDRYHGFPLPQSLQQGRGGSPLTCCPPPALPVPAAAVCRPQVLAGAAVSTSCNPWSCAKGKGSDSTSFKPHPHPKAPPTHGCSSWPHPSLTPTNSGFSFSSSRLAPRL